MNVTFLGTSRVDVLFNEIMQTNPGIWRDMLVAAFNLEVNLNGFRAELPLEIEDYILGLMEQVFRCDDEYIQDEHRGDCDRLTVLTKLYTIVCGSIPQENQNAYID